MAIIVNDTCTDTTATALTSHIGETGATWARASGDESAGGAGLQISLNQIAPTQTNAEISKYYASGSPGDNVYVFSADFIVPNSQNGSDYFAVWARHSTSANTGYEFRYFKSVGFFQMFKVVAGVQTQLGSNTGTIFDNASYRLYIDVSGDATTTIKARVQRLSDGFWKTSADAWQAGQADMMTQTDSASPITAIGKGAIVLRNASPATNIDNVQLDGSAPSAPIITGPTGAATGKDAGSGTVSTTGADGLLWRKAAAGAATDPGAGNEVANGWTSQAVSGSGAQTVTSFGALTTGVAVNANYLHVDAGGQRSSVATSPSTFTPSTLAWAGAYSAQSCVAGAAISFSGSVPTPTGGIGTKSYSATGLGASGITMNSSTGQLTGTGGTVGSYTITPTVTDQSTAGSEIPQTEALASFNLTISAAGTAPSISVQPASQTVTEGAVATFSVTASGSGALAYQWRFNGGNVGTNSSSYARTTVIGDNGGLVSVVVTGDTAPPATSSNATLTVNAASGLAGFDLHSIVGCRFGAIAGALVGLAPEVGASIVIRVYNPSTGALVATLPAAVTNSSGYLPRATHAALVVATTYTLMAVWPDGAVYAFNLVAS